MKRSLLSTIITLVSFQLAAQSVPPAYAWLAGHWTGDGFGGTSQEIWSPPAADGTMMGMYRHHKGDGSLNFYEFLTLDSTGMKIKHFHPNMTGWEEKADFVNFAMISHDENRIELSGLVFLKKSETEMEIHLSMQSGEKRWTEVFKMKRE